MTKQKKSQRNKLLEIQWLRQYKWLTLWTYRQPWDSVWPSHRQREVGRDKRCGYSCLFLRWLCSILQTRLVYHNCRQYTHWPWKTLPFSVFQNPWPKQNLGYRSCQILNDKSLCSILHVFILQFKSQKNFSSYKYDNYFCIFYSALIHF